MTERMIVAGLKGALAIVLLFLAGCVSVESRVTIQDRLDAFPQAAPPLERPVVIRWNQYMTPYIEAETDRDLAVALGLVHAHLREGQLAIAKRAAQGRLSEMGGPLASDIDHALRILDIGRAAPAIEASLPAATRLWLDSYVAGLNHYQATAPAEPPEFGLLGLEREPWSVRDVISISRIAGADANWFGYFRLLPQRGKPEYARAWRRLQTVGAAGRPSIAPEDARAGVMGSDRAVLQTLFESMGEQGSNSVVVAPDRTASGAAMIANDPHLGFILPNPWILVGLRSPSINAVGYTAPGVPVIALGRSPSIGWGGTNMRAASSELTDVSGLSPDEITERDVEIGVRLWFDETRTIRETRFGPILSDADALGVDKASPIALRWMGFEATDEFTSFLAASRARTAEEFRAAFTRYGVSAQNLLFATADGDIGMILAGRLPRRSGWPEDDLVRQADAGDVDWDRPVSTLDLPWTLNPAEGFIASANNKPAETETAIGYAFSGDDRLSRLREILRQERRIDLETMTALQTDTRSPEAERIAGELLARLDAAAIGRGSPVVAALRGWDGDYRADAFAPVAFETLLAGIMERLAPLIGFDAEVAGSWEQVRGFLAADLDRLDAPTRQSLLAEALAQAETDAARFPTWGDMHRLPVRHALANLPVIGARFVLDDLPVGGSRETPMKTAHGLVRDRHDAQFGSQARHVSDMSDPDANYFVQFGGNDGWLGSPHLSDQMPLWRDGRYIRMPLTPSRVQSEFPFAITLRPAGGGDSR